MPMNALLNNAEKWFTDLGIKTIARPFCLMVSKDDVVNLVGLNQPYQTILAELRTALNSNKLTFYQEDKQWLYLDSL